MIRPIVVAFFGLVLGCAGSTSEEQAEFEETSSEVIGGTETRDAPEVGMASFSWGSYCTATLISPRVAVTAAHCVKYATRDVNGSYGRFRIDKQPSGTVSYGIDRYRTFVRDGLGEVDVALLRLREEVPASVARPAGVATSHPSNGTALVLYGYGCNDDWEHQTGGGTKRRFQFKEGDTLRNRLCPGDSGGPVRIGSTGPVLLINSGWKSNWLGNRYDVFGDVPRHASVISSQQRSWATTDPTTGFKAEYFDNETLSGDPKVVRNERTLDFDWGSGAPESIIEGDTFSARWTSKVVPAFSEAYTLEVLSDDGIRVWVDGRLVIDDWTAHSPSTRTARVSLNADQEHDLKVEYFEKGGGATAKLFWSSASQPRQIVPSTRLRFAP